MTKSLNQAFLRAFSKGQPSAGPVPAPHVRMTGDAPRAAEHAEVTAEDGASWHRVEDQSEPETFGGRVPAPHLPLADLAISEQETEAARATAPEARIAERPEAPQLEVQETLVVSELGSASALFDTTTMVILPQNDDANAWTGFGEGGESHRAPAAAASSAAAASKSPAADSAARVDIEAHSAPRPQPAAASRPAVETSSAATRSPADSRMHTTNAAAASHAAASQAAQEPPGASVAENVDNVSANPAAATAGHAVAPTAAWEVDRLGWSETCNQLYHSEAKYFEQAGRQLSSATGEGLNVLAITSAYRGEGRTTLALLLARCAAAAGVRVAVLDADLDNPQLATAVKIQPAADWRGYLDDSSHLCEAAVHAVEDRITLFPLDSRARGEELSLADPRVTSLIERIAGCFDLLVIDMGPAASDERRVFAAGDNCPLNAAVVVRDLRSTSELQIQDVAQRLLKRGVEAVGIAENFVRRSA